MLLAVDTSTARVGLALYDGAQVLGEMVWHSQAHHTQQLAPAVAGLFERVGLKLDALQALGVATGPGSFTSLRVGLAFVKGLAMSRHLPVVGIPTLDVTAAGVPLTDRRLAAVLQSGRGRLALVWYKPGENGWQAEGPAVVITAAELEKKIRKPTLVCGELNAEERDQLKRKYRTVALASPAQCVRRPGILAELAWQRWQAGETDAPASLAPVYLHMAGGPPA